MLKIFFKQLRHPNPKVRLNAARELGRLEDERALEPLKKAFMTESDLEIRQAIQEAGRRIKKAAQERTKRRELSPEEEDALIGRIMRGTADPTLKPSIGRALTTLVAPGRVAKSMRQTGYLHQQMDLANEMSLAMRSETADDDEDLLLHLLSGEDEDEPEAPPRIKPLPPPPDSKELLRAGVQAARSGDREAARQCFCQAVEIEPQNELGWMWMAKVAASKSERVTCLQRVLAINPGNQKAHAALKKLQPNTNNKPTQPPVDLDFPEGIVGGSEVNYDDVV